MRRGSRPPRIVLAIALGATCGVLFLGWVFEHLPPVVRADALITIDVGVTRWVTHPPIVTDTVTSSRVTEGVGEAAPHPYDDERTSSTFLFLGDIMLDRMVALRMRKAKDVAYPFKKLPEHWIGSFNYTLANLEGPVTPTRRPTTKSISFQFAPSVVPVLKDEGIDAVSQANNHTFDQGRTGFTDSQALLKKGGLLAFGSELSDGEIALATTTINGTRFAFLGFNSVTKPFNRVDAARVIKEAKAQADFVIAMPHWGIEYQDMPTQSVVEMGHWFIDQGVDAIIGGHPHWAQGISVYKNKPIVWSLGNFVFDQDWSVRTNQGLTIAMTVEGKSVTLEPIPIQIKESQPRVVEGAEKEKRLKQLASISDEALREEILQNKIVFAR